jgi:hypothetical protein
VKYYHSSVPSASRKTYLVILQVLTALSCRNEDVLGFCTLKDESFLRDFGGTIIFVMDDFGLGGC